MSGLAGITTDRSDDAGEPPHTHGPLSSPGRRPHLRRAGIGLCATLALLAPIVALGIGSEPDGRQVRAVADEESALDRPPRGQLDATPAEIEAAAPSVAPAPEPSSAEASSSLPPTPVQPDDVVGSSPGPSAPEPAPPASPTDADEARTTWHGRQYFSKRRDQGVWSVADAGSDARLEIPGPHSPLDLTPDGRGLYYRRTVEPAEWEAPDAEIWRRDVDGTDTMVLSLGYWTRLRASPDGQRLAILDHRSTNVWIADPDGSDLRPVMTLPLQMGAVSWHPDSRHLLVSAFDGAYLLDVLTGTYEALDATFRFAEWAPSGDHLAMFGLIDGLIGLFLLDPGSGAPTSIWSTPYDPDHAPFEMEHLRWSADGRSISYWQTAVVDGRRVEQLRAMDLAGRSRLLAQFPY